MLHMAQWSFPFPDVGGDRMYSDDDFAKYYSFLYNTGVFMPVGDALLVKSSPTQGMRVIISMGAAGINGRFYFNSADLALDVPVASTTQDRIDSVVLRLDMAARMVTLAYKTNSTTVVRTDLVYELQLARVGVKRNASGITSADIEDMRANQQFCGYVTPHYEVPVSGMEAQYQTMLQQVFDSFSQAAEANQEALEQLLINQQTLFLDWFNALKSDSVTMLAEQTNLIQDWFANLQNELDANQALNLQNQITKLKADQETFSVTHDFKSYPQVAVTAWSDGLCVTGVGETTWLGTAPETIPCTVVYPSWNELAIKVPLDFKMVNPVVTETEPLNFLLVEGRKSLRIKILGGI